MVRDSDVEYLEKYLSKEKLDDGIRRLEKGESPQYIVGNVDFYGNLIEVNSNVLIPRFETELLVDKAVNYIKTMFSNYLDLSILDIGTGSGCIAITLQKEFGCHVVASDVSLEALHVAKRNAISNGADISFVRSDVFSNIDGVFDVIISNPPYIRVDEEIEDIVKNNEPELALYAMEEGLYFYHTILENCKRYLNKNFMIAFEIGELQGEEVRNIAFRYLENIDVSIEKDYSGRDRFVFIFSK